MLYQNRLPYECYRLTVVSRPPQVFVANPLTASCITYQQPFSPFDGRYMIFILPTPLPIVAGGDLGNLAALTEA